MAKDPFGTAIQDLAPNIFIAQPRRDASQPLLQNLPQMEGLAWPYGTIIRYGSTDGLNTVEARTALIQKALDDNAEYLWFVDDDTVVPFHGLAQLFYAARMHSYPVIGGVVPLKQDPLLPVTICSKDNRLYYPDLSYADEIVPCNWVTGFACLLIHCDVFRRMQADDPGMPIVWATANLRETPIGEDGWFCHRCHRLKIPIMIHRAVQCRHYDLATKRYWGGEGTLEYYLSEATA